MEVKCNISQFSPEQVFNIPLAREYEGIPLNIILNISSFSLIIIVFAIWGYFSWNLSQEEEDVEEPWLTQNIPSKPPLQVHSYGAWLKSIFFTKDEIIEEKCGKDSVIYLDFQRASFEISLEVMLLSLVIIIPLNNTGLHIHVKETLSHFQHTTLANISGSSHIQWVHFTLAYLIFERAYSKMHSLKCKHFGYQDETESKKNVTIENVPATNWWWYLKFSIFNVGLLALVIFVTTPKHILEHAWNTT